MQALLSGCGKMCGALISKWGKARDMSFTTVDSELTNASYGARLATNLKILDEQYFDVIIVEIKPQFVDTILPNYRDPLDKAGVLVSITAGFSTHNLQWAAYRL